MAPSAVEQVRRTARRLVTVPAALALALLAVLTAPLWIPALAIVDAAGRGSRAGLRCGAFFTFYLQCEAAGLLASFLIWVGSGGGRFRGRLRDGSFRLQCWWASLLWEGSCRIFGMELSVEGADAVAESPLILLPRHASVADTLLAAVLVSRPHGTRLRYVLKRELLWDPCLDVVGNRLENCFVDRDSDDSARQVERVARLAADLGADEGVLIYPEGTRFTPAKRERVLARIAETGDPALLERAKRLEHVLPPRLGGSLALLEANPGADVVFCAHTGLEGAGTFWDLWHGALVGARVRVCFWRVPFAEIPAEREARVAWLFAGWSRIDAWIAANA